MRRRELLLVLATGMMGGASRSRATEGDASDRVAQHPLARHPRWEPYAREGNV